MAGGVGARPGRPSEDRPGHTPSHQDTPGCIRVDHRMATSVPSAKYVAIIAAICSLAAGYVLVASYGLYCGGNLQRDACATSADISSRDTKQLLGRLATADPGTDLSGPLLVNQPLIWLQFRLKGFPERLRVISPSDIV